jgi:hypothetical protein
MLRQDHPNDCGQAPLRLGALRRMLSFPGRGRPIEQLQAAPLSFQTGVGALFAAGGILEVAFWVGLGRARRQAS